MQRRSPTLRMRPQRNEQQQKLGGSANCGAKCESVRPCARVASTGKCLLGLSAASKGNPDGAQSSTRSADDDRGDDTDWPRKRNTLAGE